MTEEAFDSWREALSLDKRNLLTDSQARFHDTAKTFFDQASTVKASVARAYFEYSTLMDACAKVQEGRLLKSELKFDESLGSFSKATDILRATMHFAFLAGYVSGCASLETAMDLEDNEERFQGLKNSIALFEQAKIALSFRDERHPLIRSIDAAIKFAISRAFLVEAKMLDEKGSLSNSRKKKVQSENVAADFRNLSGLDKSQPLTRYKLDYFLNGYECERSLSGSFLTTFPERTNLWIGNVGVHPAKIHSLGRSEIGKIILPSQSIVWPLVAEFRGKLRIAYSDGETNSQYDEGCLTVI